MAKTTLEVEIIANTKKLDRALKGKKIGVGGKGDSKEQKKQTKDGGILVGLTKKVVAAVAGVAAILTALDFIISPLAAILTAILTLLFLPLIPVFKPALEALVKFMPFMQKISGFLTKVVEFQLKMNTGIVNILKWTIKLFDVFKGFVKGVATLGLWVWQQIIKPGFLPLLNVGERIFNEILKPGFDFVREALLTAANAILSLIDRLPFISVDPIGGGGGGGTISPAPNQGFIGPTRPFTPIPTGNSVTINNPIVREKSDIKKIADAVSKVLASNALRGGVFNLI